MADARRTGRPALEPLDAGRRRTYVVAAALSKPVGRPSSRSTSVVAGGGRILHLWRGGPDLRPPWPFAQGSSPPRVGVEQATSVLPRSRR